ncbi:MAG: DinB family protein [Anaerolineales bacterium]|nr:DinB family protein [Anaerolineales bacterium]
MKSNQANDVRKAWNAEHGQLRRLLEKGHDPSKVIEPFLHHHAMIHSAQLHAGGAYSFQDEVLHELTEKQMRYQVPGHANSVVWLLWHITRIEDATMNVLLADAPQVFHLGKWQGKLRSAYVDVGNEMTGAEIRMLSEAIDMKALFAYRLAVGQRTREIIRQLHAADLVGKPLPERLERLAADGTVRPKAQWLLAYWGGHSKTNLLLMPATRHGFVHFNEIGRMLPKLRRAVT